MTDLMELTARVAASTGPDRDLDCAIFCATAHSPFQNYYPDCVLASQGGFAARLEIPDIPKFTASLDAALTLMPDGLDYRLEKCGDIRHGYGAAAYKPGAPSCYPGVRLHSGATPALALLASILKARQAMATTSTEPAKESA